jgi:multicomponent Na+:H+ antiporter subunit D
VASLLTLLAIARVWNRVFWRSTADAENPDPVLLATAPDAAGGHSMRAVRTSRHVQTSEGRFSGDNDVPILPKMMVFSTFGLVALGVALSVFAGPLFALSDHAAESMLERTPYIEAVLGSGAAAK